MASDSVKGPVLINNKKNLFAEVSKNFGLLPGSQIQGLNIMSALDESTQTPGSGSPLEVIRREAEIIAHDVVVNAEVDNARKPPNKYCKTMRRTTKELSDRHDIVFKGMVNKLQVDEQNVFNTFVHVADEIFDDGQINWGRIVAVYTFAVRLARHYMESNKSYPEKIALYVGKYVGNKLGMWILQHGGWDAFAEYFPDHGETEDKVWKGLLFTAVGLGALATVVAAR